jgi:tetratricopeptide (TPR) repeat protein
MSTRFAKVRESLPACRSAGDAAKAQMRLFTIVLTLLLLPSTAAAQRDQFYSALVTFYRGLSGLYGDEGAQITGQLAAMTAALERWDAEISAAERELRSRLPSADAQTQLQIHTVLASLYLERGRFSDAVREFDRDIGLDPNRAAFHRFKGLVLQALGRHDEAADAFRRTWLLEPADPQNAYRLIAQRSARTTDQEIQQAADALAIVERRLIRREQPGSAALFTNIRSINDDAGGAMAFVPAAYMSGFSLVFQGELENGVTAFRAAVADDPLVTDPASRSDPMVRGIAALRGGLVPAAIELLEAAVAGAAGSSEAHRVLATAYSIAGDIAKSENHLRAATRLNRRDERSWLALARTLEQAGRTPEAADILRRAVAEVSAVSPVRWRLSTTSENLQHADDAELLATADRFVLLVGKGELYRALARLAQLHADDATAIRLLQQAVLAAPNNAAAHLALGRAFAENGREGEAYAELAIALLLDPANVETLTELGRVHLTAGRPERAVEALDRAIGIDPGNRISIRALADASIAAGRKGEAKQLLEESERLQVRAIEDDRRAKAGAALRTNAEVSMGQRDYASAVDLWRQALALQGGNAAIHLRLAQALTEAKRLDEAAAEYRTAISLQAGPDAHRRLAEVYDALGRPEEASRERATHVQRRLDELRQRAEQGAFGF